MMQCRGMQCLRVSAKYQSINVSCHYDVIMKFVGFSRATIWDQAGFCNLIGIQCSVTAHSKCFVSFEH